MDPRIRYAIKIMKKNYGKRLRLKQMAREVDLSPSGFRHLFKEETGQDWRTYLLELRLAKTQELLRSQMPIKSVASQVGYSHARNFARIFEKRMGKTPSTYRKKHTTAHWEGK